MTISITTQAYFFGSCFILDSCLYARNTINAIITKLIISEIKSPHINFDFPIVNDMAFRSPAGMNLLIDLLQMLWLTDYSKCFKKVKELLCQ